jgi:predicted O-methyltransferase YrrM
MAAIHSTVETFYEKVMDQVSVWFKRCAAYIDGFLFKQRLRQAGVSGAGKIPTWTHRSELRALYDLAVTLPQGAVALEIGSYLGASTCSIAAGLTQVGGHLFCVDTWENETMPDGLRNTFAEFEKNTRGIRAYVTPVRKKSTELTAADLRLPLDFVFIDGDHNYLAVKDDFERVQPWLTEDGIIAFHDFNNTDYEGVTRVIGEALASGQWRMAGIQRTLVWIQRATWSNPAWLAENSQK